MQNLCSISESLRSTDLCVLCGCCDPRISEVFDLSGMGADVSVQQFYHLDIFIIRAQARQPGSGALRYCTGRRFHSLCGQFAKCGRLRLPLVGGWVSFPCLPPCPHPLLRRIFFPSSRLLFVREKPSHLSFICLSKALDWLQAR